MDITRVKQSDLIKDYCSSKKRRVVLLQSAHNFCELYCKVKKISNEEVSNGLKLHVTCFCIFSLSCIVPTKGRKVVGVDE